MDEDNPNRIGNAGKKGITCRRHGLQPGIQVLRVPGQCMLRRANETGGQESIGTGMHHVAAHSTRRLEF